MFPLSSIRADPGLGFRRGFVVTAGVGGAVLLGIWVYTTVNGPSSDVSESVDTLASFGFVLFAALACAWGARRRDVYFRAWAFLTFALALCSLSSAITIFYALTGKGGAAFPTLSDYAYLAYVVPGVAALLAMPIPRIWRTARWRLVLDALVITLGVLLLSWVTVLQPVVQTFGLDTVTGRARAAFPVIDVLIYSAVLTLGMRAPPGERLMWGLLGGGLAALAITDSVYVGFSTIGTPNLGTHPLIFGWMVAPLLVALATMVRPGSHLTDGKATAVTLGLEFFPYVPVVVAIVVTGVHGVDRSAFIIIVAGLLLVCLLTRQVMIVLEKLTLTKSLKRKLSELAQVGSIVTSSRDAIFGVSVNGQVTSANPAAERLFGIPAAVLAAGPQSNLVSPHQLQGLQQMIQSVQRGEGVTAYETGWVRPDGSRIQIGLTVSPILDDGVFQGVSISGQDITERTQVAASLVQAREDALESSRLKSEFLATMSHEIRTPMNGVLGLTELLMGTSLDRTQRQYAEGVKTAGEALMTVINDVLDFSKLEAGKVDLELVDFSVGKLVDEVGSLLAPVAAGKDVELLAYCWPDVPDLLRGDPGRIRQVLLNLASNAVKFTAAGEVAIKVEMVDLVDEVVRVRFAVSDTGIGIDEAGRALLFQAFSQVDASTTRRYGGTGLGLAISSRLVRAMQGEIDVSSQPGRGSTFWFEISLALSSAPVTDPLTLSRDQLAGKRVIVVDDNATNRQIVAAHLTNWHAHSDLAEDAQSALLLMRAKAAQGTPYDIAVLDMCMPDVDGLDLATTISGEPELRNTRMILLTSSLLLDVAAIQQAGISEWLNKPVRSSDLYDRLLRLVGTPPLPTTPAADPQPVSTPSRESLGRILVAEDNSLNQLVAEGILNVLGYQVNIVANGRQALDALSSTSYAAVLMDCHMPIMDGFEATKAIRRRRDQNTTIPIIAMTAGAMLQDRKRCLEAGMDDYVSKPIDVQAMGELLRKWVRTDPTTVGDAPIDQHRLTQLRQLGALSNSDLLTKVVNLFINQFPERVAAIRDAVQQGLDDDLKEAAHALRGAASNVGATRVAGLCLMLELGEAIDHDEATRLTDQLTIELEVACHRLKQAIDITQPEGQATRPAEPSAGV